MWLRDVVPTIVVFVTKSSYAPQSPSLQQATVSTILITDTVVFQTPVTNAGASSVVLMSTVPALVMSLTPLSLPNPTTFITLLTSSVLSTFSAGTASNSLSSTNAIGTSYSVSVTKAASSASPSSFLAPDPASTTNLSLAIALPIGIICFIGLIVLSLFLFRKKLGVLTDKILMKRTDESLNTKSSEIIRPIQKIPRDESAPHRSDSSATIMEIEHSTRPKGPTFLNRISRVFNVPGLPLDFRSPTLLRRFNLQSAERGPKPLGPMSDINCSTIPTKKLPNIPSKTFEYDSRLGTRSSSGGSTGQGSKPSESLYSVIKPYVKRLNDEITVCIGEEVKILKSHSDGWATVKLATSSEVGVIPLMCLRKSA